MNIAVNNLINKRKNMADKQKHTTFEANPLDVNIAKIQLSLLKRFEREVPENGDFAPVYEEFISKDPTLDLSTVRVYCKHVDDESPKKNIRCIEVSCKNKAQTNEKTEKIISGTKKEVFDFLNKTDFFEMCKKTLKE